MDDDTSKMNSLHCGKVRMTTKCMEFINKTINLSCEGLLHLVKVREEQLVISEVIHNQCKCCILQNKGEDHSSNGEVREQMSEVESKKDVKDAEVVGQVGGELDNEDDMVEGGFEKMLDGQNDKDGQGSWEMYQWLKTLT